MIDAIFNKNAYSLIRERFAGFNGRLDSGEISRAVFCDDVIVCICNFICLWCKWKENKNRQHSEKPHPNPSAKERELNTLEPGISKISFTEYFISKKFI